MYRTATGVGHYFGKTRFCGASKHGLVTRGVSSSGTSPLSENPALTACDGSLIDSTKRSMDVVEGIKEDDMNTALVQGVVDSGEALPANGDAAHADAAADKKTRRLARRNVATLITCTSFMLSLYGYDFGITAWTVLLIKSRGAEEASSLYVYLATHGEALGILVACSAIGGTIGGMIGRKIGNSHGRKAEMRLVSILCICGATLEGISGMMWWYSMWDVALYAAGRLLYGVGLGLSLRCGPMYLRETVTASYKDAATVSVKLSMVCGMIVSYIIGGVLSNTLWGYFGAVGIAGVSLVCLQFLPESPLYMLLREDKFTKTQILHAVRFTNPTATTRDVQELHDEVLTEVLAYTPGRPSYGGGTLSGNTSADILAAADTGTDCARGNANGVPTAGVAVKGGDITTDADCGVARDRCSARGGSGGGHDGYGPLGGGGHDVVSVARSVKNLPSLTKDRGMRAALMLTAGLMVFEQASGMTAVLYYGGIFLADIDIISVDVGLAFLGILQLVVAIGVIYTMHPIGRKPLLLGGLGVVLVSTAMLTTGGILGMGTGGRWWALFGLYSFTASYSVSLGALVWVLVAEVFPTCHRAQAISIVSTAHFAACAIVVVMLPLAQDIGGYSCMFFCFFVVAIFANLFAHRYMVETRGLTLVQVQRALTVKAGIQISTDTNMRSANV